MSHTAWMSEKISIGLKECLDVSNQDQFQRMIIEHQEFQMEAVEISCSIKKDPSEVKHQQTECHLFSVIKNTFEDSDVQLAHINNESESQLLDISSNEDQEEELINELDPQNQHQPYNRFGIFADIFNTSVSPDPRTSSPTPNLIHSSQMTTITEERDRYGVEKNNNALGNAKKKIWTAFKKDHLPNLNEINEGVGKHPQYRQTRSYKFWSILNDMGRYV